jgi:hypothetical protein
MEDNEREMASRWFGYGPWDAPYWFIGPEPGQARDENDGLGRRIEAWLHFGGGELSDCRAFHERIGETRWHRERPQLQPCWRRLLVLLMTFLERSSDKESIRNYQRDEWGRLGGETCVIELSALAANNFEVPRDRKLFREERIGHIRQRICRHKPEWVVMYGLSEKKHWEQIAGGAFGPENMRSLESTIIALTPHPNTRGLTDTHWKNLGERLRCKLRA